MKSPPRRPFNPPLPNPTATNFSNSSHQTIPDLDARIRNVKLLVEDLPWVHKPFLLALAALFTAIAPSSLPASSSGRLPSDSSLPSRNTRSNNAGNDNGAESAATFLTEGVTVIDETELDVDIGSEVTCGVAIRDAAESLAPALLRYPPATRRDASGGDAADQQPRRLDWEEELAAAAVVELILSEQKRVLEGMRAEQELR